MQVLLGVIFHFIGGFASLHSYELKIHLHKRPLNMPHRWFYDENNKLLWIKEAGDNNHEVELKISL